MTAFPDPDDRLVVEPGCERCPELVDCRERISWGNGPTDADVVVEGEAPASGEPVADRWKGGNWTGMAYTSRHSGRRVRGDQPISHTAMNRSRGSLQPIS